MMKRKFYFLIVFLFLIEMITACSGNIKYPIENDDSVMSSVNSVENQATDDSANSIGNDSAGSQSIGDSSMNYITGSQENSTQSEEDCDSFMLTALQYPEGTVQTLEQRNMTVSSFCGRATTMGTYAANCGYDGLGIVISPYFTCQSSGVEIPVYATPVYVATMNSGVLHSFSTVNVRFGDCGSFLIALQAKGFSIKNVEVLSNSDADCSFSNNTITLQVSSCDTYTFMFNNGQQDVAYTLFVREYVDEDKEIADYIQEYGEKNVTVYDAGIHTIDYKSFYDNGKVLYLRSGSIVLPNHKYDINSDDDNKNTEEFGASYGSTAIRFPVINGYKVSDIKLIGQGTIDFTQLDWYERGSINFSFCNNITIDGVFLINSGGWTVYTYKCTNLTIHNSVVFGYRTCSDAFAVCNTQNATITNCFARTGDDMFEVKTLGGSGSDPSTNITYQNCYAWGSKARCFGITGEVEKDISNILFENCYILYRDATWNNSRLGGLVVIRENGNGAINGITFRNIKIYYDAGRAINCSVFNESLNNSKISNILFENVTYKAVEDSLCTNNRGANNSMQILLKNIKANDVLLTSSNLNSYWDYDSDNIISFTG